jgi:hypothetical protein
MAIGVGQPSAIALPYYRFQRNYMWDVLLPDVGFPALGLIGFALGQLVQEVSFGDYSIKDPHKMRFGPYEAKFAGLLTTETLDMTFLKTMPDAVSAYFNAWKNLIISPAGLYYPKFHYQKTIMLRFTDVSGITLGQYAFINCFPVIFPSYELSYKNSEVTKVDVSFEVDRIEYTTF